MPFLDHLEELRWRIVKSLAALGIAFSASFWVAWRYLEPVMKVLIDPIRPMLPSGGLVYTHPMGIYTIIMQVAGLLALVVASPVVGYQVWAFLSPALSARERKVIVPVLAFGALLFLVGVALAVLVFVPMTVKLGMSISVESLTPLITAKEYFGFITIISLAFGAIFEMPILVLILTALGLVTPSMLTKGRRWAAALSLVAAMIITPGDVVVATLALWVPIYGLYELSIVVSWFVYRARRKREAQAESIGSGAEG
ncbi:MAG: twin-arginine translocase subunit TatC [Gemmatimonadetes bacterium]|nr:twin-arginine translocase subunit TatC [Gemmatimonadota bacterium]